MPHNDIIFLHNQSTPSQKISQHRWIYTHALSVYESRIHSYPFTIRNRLTNTPKQWSTQRNEKHFTNFPNRNTHTHPYIQKVSSMYWSIKMNNTLPRMRIPIGWMREWKIYQMLWKCCYEHHSEIPIKILFHTSYKVYKFKKIIVQLFFFVYVFYHQYCFGVDWWRWKID